ncbi:hypothetical protein ACGF07_25735 [Kitasatospora sp. NPDC048194]|uniref:hypothetical protein n=1 Tax=Kitasatospora sp. NPDC048194 TaxID=3364045 RepID=UPI003711A1A4
MTKKVAPPNLTAEYTAEERLRLYTVEEVIDMKLLPYTARTLRDAAHRRRVPHTTVNRKVRFRLEHILQIQLACDVDPASRGSRRAA